MSLPTHSKWKCLPEIHASRISVSGSLRPKLGLLLLSVVLLVSLVFILVPVITKLQSTDSQSTSYPVLPLPLASILSRVSLASSSPIILSPSSLLASLATVNVSSLNKDSLVCQTSVRTANVNISSTVIVKKGFKVERNCVEELVKVIEAENISDTATQHLSEYFHESSSFINSSHVASARHAVVLVTSSVKLVLPGHSVHTLDTDHVIMSGPVQVSDTPHYTVIRLADQEQGAQLYLIQPHRDHHLSVLTHNMLDMADIGTSHLQLVLPSHIFRSSISLGSELSAAGHNRLNVPVYHQSSVQFTSVQSQAQVMK